MTPLLAVAAILALFVGGLALVARVDKLAFLAPKSSAALSGPVGEFCRDSCRTAQGVCPLSGSAAPALNCPLWKFVETDVSTTMYGSPFAAPAK